MSETSSETRSVGKSSLFRLLVIFFLSGIVAAVWHLREYREEEANTRSYDPAAAWIHPKATNWVNPNIKIAFHPIPIKQSDRAGLVATGPASNIRRQDYVGPDSCRECHQENYEHWSKHSHRLMNALAVGTNVMGDFSGKQTIAYSDGRGEFYQQDDRFYMRLSNKDSTNLYQIKRTIGSRFFQYYTGIAISSDGKPPMIQSEDDQVLPFGYWLDFQKWVPAVHVFSSVDSDETRMQPFVDLEKVSYDQSCARCHTTLPVGDLLLRDDGDMMSKNSPRSLAFEYPAYLKEDHPALYEDFQRAEPTRDKNYVRRVAKKIRSLSVQDRAVSLGISCESCHNGCLQHVENSTKTSSTAKPAFFPASPHLFVEGKDREDAVGRNPINRNFTCARCHSGARSTYANGDHTWNSTEYTTAIQGFCYDSDKARASSMQQLTCVQCHNPHAGIGKKWIRTPSEDDQSCLDCHSQLANAKTRLAHTHHPAGTAGDRCMNCHMPKINEGMQDMVRTHRICNPTDPLMIESDQPNACNICHVKEPINWTLTKLQEWYGSTYSEEKIAAKHPRRDEPVALGWIKGGHGPTRLVGASALVQARATWALPELAGLLDDPLLINRQFVQMWLEAWLDLDLSKEGYEFYQDETERPVSLKKIEPMITAAATR